MAVGGNVFFGGNDFGGGGKTKKMEVIFSAVLPYHMAVIVLMVGGNAFFGGMDFGGGGKTKKNGGKNLEL